MTPSADTTSTEPSILPPRLAEAYEPALTPLGEGVYEIDLARGESVEMVIDGQLPDRH
ncbi:MAG: hypothetical protein R3336_00020 [Phycisphaeraceae bacterium]|nr:hypothetical protein [Phycisphaeraceae bacterium]